jgi:colanic acid/amylovoran biosynthesis glycosyltransferase
MSLRLGYLVPEFPSQTHVFFWREIQALRGMGEEVFLLSTRRPSPLTCRHDFAAEAAAGTRYLFPPAPSSLAVWMAGGARGLSQSLEYLVGLEPSGLKGRLRQCGLLSSAIDLVQWTRHERIDHVHGHSCADAAHVLALARSMGGPSYSLTLHGDLEVYGTDHRSKMAGAAFVCTVGNHLRRQLLDRVAFPADRVFVTCMGVDTSATALLGKDRSYVPGVLHLVTVARLHPLKGHVHALAAVSCGVKAGLDLHYTIAGEGPYKEALRARISELGLESRVTLTGTLSETEVYQLLSEADAFVLPSVGLGEAWPVSVMEAMSAGLPVIASVIGATPQMITSGRDGFLVPQRDEKALFENIMLLANNVDMRRRVGEAARHTAYSRFNVAVTASALRDAIRMSLEGMLPTNQSSPIVQEYNSSS